MEKKAGAGEEILKILSILKILILTNEIRKSQGGGFLDSRPRFHEGGVLSRE